MASEVRRFDNRNGNIFGLNRIVIFDSNQSEIECTNLDIKLDNCSVITGDASYLFLGKGRSSTCFVKTDASRNATIQATFLTRKPLAEIGLVNYRGEKSTSYGVKGLILVVNSVSIFSGDLGKSQESGESVFSLRLFVNQIMQQSSNTQVNYRNQAHNKLNNTGINRSRGEELPSLVKHKSQDISVSSQQSDTSSGKVLVDNQIRKHPRVASSINNLFKFAEPKNSERSKSSQRARIVDRSNKLQSESNYLSLFSKLYYPLERKKTDAGSLIRDISNTEDNLLSNRTMADAERGHSYGQGMTDYGLPPHPSRKSLYMVDLLKRNLSTTSKTMSTEKKFNAKPKGPMVERVSFIGDFIGLSDKRPANEPPAEARTSIGGLKIFQKVSEDIIHKKNSVSLRSSFAAPGFLPRDLSDLVAKNHDQLVIPDLPQGSILKVCLLSNWGDPEE